MPLARTGDPAAEESGAGPAHPGPLDVDDDIAGHGGGRRNLPDLVEGGIPRGDGAADEAEEGGTSRTS